MVTHAVGGGGGGGRVPGKLESNLLKPESKPNFFISFGGGEGLLLPTFGAD